MIFLDLRITKRLLNKPKLLVPKINIVFYDLSFTLSLALRQDIPEAQAIQTMHLSEELRLIKSFISFQCFY